jgi:hypothetical protein
MHLIAHWRKAQDFALAKDLHWRSTITVLVKL